MAAQGRRPGGFRQRAQGEEFSRQKAKIKRQKSLSRALGRIREGPSRSDRKQNNRQFFSGARKLTAPWNLRRAQRMGLYTQRQK